MAEAYLVYITARDVQEAERIARALVERGLAACVNVLPAVRSWYRWQGRLVEDSEALLLVKAPGRTLEALERAVKELHSYEVPAISAIPVERVHEPYLRWMQEVTRGGGA